MKNPVIWSSGLKVLTCCGLMTLAVGCVGKTSGLKGSATVAQTPDGTMQSSQYVIIDNSRIARGLQIVDLKSQFVGDLLHAQVSMVSKYSKTLDFQYKFRWFDTTGMEISPDSLPWIPLKLFGNESKTVQAVAPNPSAREFKIQIRAK